MSKPYTRAELRRKLQEREPHVPAEKLWAGEAPLPPDPDAVRRMTRADEKSQ